VLFRVITAAWKTRSQQSSATLIGVAVSWNGPTGHLAVFLATRCGVEVKLM